MVWRTRKHGTAKQKGTKFKVPSGARRRPLKLRPSPRPRSAMAMSIPKIRDEINRLLYDRETQAAYKAKDRELLVVVVSREKAHHLGFLTGKTQWKVLGEWKGEKEKNTQLEIEFKDNRKEEVGRRLEELLRALNVKQIGEERLYFRTMPIEEGGLNLAPQ